MKKFLLFLILILVIPQLYAQLSYSVSGKATYYDVDLGKRKPIVNAYIRVETYNPQVTVNGFYPSTYTDNNGNYYISLGVNLPEQVTVRIFFKNKYVDVRGFETTHSESIIAHKVIRPPQDGIPNDFELPGSEFHNLNFQFGHGAKNNKYSKVFMMGNVAANFARIKGYDPSQVILKYPAESSFFSNINVDVQSCFF